MMSCEGGDSDEVEHRPRELGAGHGEKSSGGEKAADRNGSVFLLRTTYSGFRTQVLPLIE